VPAESIIAARFPITACIGGQYRQHAETVLLGVATIMLHVPRASAQSSAAAGEPAQLGGQVEALAVNDAAAFVEHAGLDDAFVDIQTGKGYHGKTPGKTGEA